MLLPLSQKPSAERGFNGPRADGVNRPVGSVLIRPVNPIDRNIAIDANALDRADPARAAAVDRLCELHQANRFNLIVPKGVRAEFLHPKTPDDVKALGLPHLYSIEVELTPHETRMRQDIERELQGNARPGKHTADADHLFESSKYCSYFITHDERIINRSGDLRSILVPSLSIVTLIEFLVIFDKYDEACQT